MKKHGSINDEPPWHELTVLDEIENTAEFYPIATVPFDDWHMHIMEHTCAILALPW